MGIQDLRRCYDHIRELLNLTLADNLIGETC